MRTLVALILLVASVTPLVDAASFTVSACGFAWCPSSLSIEVGDSVTFSFGSGFHTWVRDDEPDACDATCSRTFASPTLVSYHCGIHLSMTGVIQVGPGPEVVITTPAAGAVVSGLVLVEGAASTPSGSIASVAVRFDAGAPVEATLVGSGASVAWSAQISSAALSEGAHAIVARATATTGFFGEASVPVVVDNPDRIDLRVTSIGAQSGATTTNTISYFIRNDGNAPSGAFRARAEYQYHGTWRLIGERSHASVGALATTSGSIVWDPPLVLVGSFPVRVIADATQVVPDVDRTNNIREGTAGWISSQLPGTDPNDPV